MRRTRSSKCAIRSLVIARIICCGLCLLATVFDMSGTASINTMHAVADKCKAHSGVRRLQPCDCLIDRSASFLQDPHHLYFLFDLMPGGDLMDVLVAEAKIIKHPVPQKGSLRQGCLAPKVRDPACVTCAQHVSGCSKLHEAWSASCRVASSARRPLVSALKPHQRCLLHCHVRWCG